MVVPAVTLGALSGRQTRENLGTALRRGEEEEEGEEGGEVGE